MGSKKPANPIVSVLAMMSLLLVLFGFFRELAIMQSENDEVNAHQAYHHLSTDTRTEMQNGSEVGEGSEKQYEAKYSNTDPTEEEENIDHEDAEKFD